MTLPSSELETAGSMVRSTLRNLTPGTDYMVTVAAVNGASEEDGLGMISVPTQTSTQSGMLVTYIGVHCLFGPSFGGTVRLLEAQFLLVPKVVVISCPHEPFLTKNPTF